MSWFLSCIFISSNMLMELFCESPVHKMLRVQLQQLTFWELIEKKKTDEILILMMNSISVKKTNELYIGEETNELSISTNLCCSLLLAITQYSIDIHDARRKNWISCCPYCNFHHGSNIDRGSEQGSNEGKLFKWFCMLENLQWDCH